MSLVLYDLDGTLVDTLQDLTQAANAMLAQLGASPIGPEDVRRAVGRGVTELVRGCLASHDPDRVQAGVRHFLDYYGRHLLDHSRLYPGARELLDHFRSRPQAVITNKPDPYARELLEGLGVSGYFFDIVAGDARYPKKPDPAAVLALARQAGAVLADTLLIGDSPIDIETGRRSGARTACVLHGFCQEGELRAAGPDLLVRDFAELLAEARRRAW